MPEKLRRAQDEYAELGPALRYAGNVEDAVADADLVVDFVPDELESKLEIFSLLDRMAPPRTILCTPTTALSITDLASCTYRPDRCLAVRGTAPEQGIVVVSSRFTSGETLAAVTGFWEALGAVVSSASDEAEPMLVKNTPA